MKGESLVEMERELEQKRVNTIIKVIDHKSNKILKHLEKVGGDALEIRQNFWNDVTVNTDEADDLAETFSSIKQQAQLLLERERSQSQLDKQLNTLFRLKNSPYFGRVDFLENTEPATESIYIGISSLMDEKDENFLIFDWRAPISSLYYDYSPGEAKYITPEGTIEGVIELKRQFLIRNSVIQGMFDTGITIGDEMLQEVLGNNANSQMKSIVATIQKEQNRIIRDEKSKLLIVQGVAGSGKTSAALQRVAYLLYRYRGKITSQNIMLFSPNPLFNSYVSTVLPELGEENMQQSTFLEFLSSRVGRKLELEDSFMQLESLLSSDQISSYELRMKSIKIKSSLDYKIILDDYIQKLNDSGLQFHPIVFKGKVLLSAEDITEKFYSLDKQASIPSRMEDLQEWLLKEIRKHKRAEAKKDWVKEEIQFLDKEDYLESFKKLQKKENDGFQDFDVEEKFLSSVVVARYFKPLIKKIKRYQFINYEEIYRNLFFTLSGEWEEVVGLSLRQLEEGILTYEDATPFVYLKEKIEGSKSRLSIKHVFIDEAQDYSPFQFAYIRELFPVSKMTLLGDINQGIYAHTDDTSSILLGEDAKDKETIILTKSYRSTRPIVEFTKGLLPNGEMIEPFNRDGEKPTLTIYKKKESHEQGLQNLLDQLVEAGHETIAVICKTAKESATVYASLKNSRDVHLVEKGTISFEKGITVIPAYLAKGIEFDAVIIHDGSQHTYFRENERRLFYTACTRAMHELHILSLGEPSMLLKDSMEKLQAASK